MSSGDFVFFVNRPLNDADTGRQTSSIGEPSVGNNGRQVFLTGNWYASRSLDHGASWTYVSPFAQLPPVDGGFCCDQTVLYDPSRDLLFWLLQYSEGPDSNTLRLAVKSGPTLDRDDWYWWDFRPGDVDAGWRREWFDYNHAALSDNFLYIGSNVFEIGTDRFTRSVVLRLPLDELREGDRLSFDVFDSERNGSLRCVQGARDVMYFASHESHEEIRLFSWPESEPTVAQRTISISPWREDDYRAPSPDGGEWLLRCDGRITGSWVADGVIGFLWSAARLGDERPFPYVRVIRIDETALELLDEPDIWSSETAYAYPDASTNDRGHVGITLFRGGGGHQPGHVVGMWDDYSSPWSLAVTQEGTDSPQDGLWGDYLTCRRHSPDGLTWLACGYTLQGGSDVHHVEPRIVHFGRRRDTGAVLRWRDA